MIPLGFYQTGIKSNSDINFGEDARRWAQENITSRTKLPQKVTYPYCNPTFEKLSYKDTNTLTQKYMYTNVY